MERSHSGMRTVETFKRCKVDSCAAEQRIST